MVIYTALRLTFWAYNTNQFTEATGHAATLILLRGLQQDLVSIIWLNTPVILLLLVAAWIRSNRDKIIRIIRWLFVTLNTFGLALNCIDAGYYRFSRHRSNLDLLYTFTDSISSFKSIMTGYWLLILIFIAGIAALVWIGKRYLPLPARSSLPATSPSPPSAQTPARLLLVQIVVVFLLLLPLGFFGNGRPVIPSTPLLSLSPEQLPLAQNSIGTFLYSIAHRQKELNIKQYFTPAELDRIAQTTHRLGKDTSTFVRKNVVVCILESFSRCYITPGDPYKAHTPFFDSLIRKSLYFPRAYANAYTSNQGIVAILGGLPAFLEEPFYYSEYANTPLKSLGNILKAQGYDTHFFMGAGKDHFGFGKFSHMAGIDHTWWQTDFNDDTQYDGNWGIFDEPFLQYGAKVLAEIKEPFMAVFFNISSHYPYTIPEKDRTRFADPAQTPAQRSIGYVDYSFQQFFAACRKAPWFKNTLFVFSADHWLYPDEKMGYSSVNSGTIPIFIYDPSGEGRVDSNLASQVDITPTVLDMLHYKGSYTGFGRSLLDNTIAPSDRYALSRYIYNYQVIDPGFVLGYNTVQEKTAYMYRYTSDSLLKKNLAGDKTYEAEQKRLETLVKGSLQLYSKALHKRSLE